MSIKSLPKKIGNGIKAKSNNIFQTIDFATGGTLSLFVQTILKSHQGFIKEKFDNLLLDLANNDIQEKELFDFINDTKLQSTREFLSNLLIKNFHADNRITIFILAKLWANKIKNGSLNYYESSLFTNINTFTYEDFEIFYNVIQSPLLKKDIDQYEFQVSETNEYYVTVLEKFKNLGILQQSTNYVVPSKYPVSTFAKTSYSDLFHEMLKSFFNK